MSGKSEVVVTKPFGIGLRPDIRGDGLAVQVQLLSRTMVNRCLPVIPENELTVTVETPDGEILWTAPDREVPEDSIYYGSLDRNERRNWSHIWALKGAREAILAHDTLVVRAECDMGSQHYGPITSQREFSTESFVTE